MEDRGRLSLLTIGPVAVAIWQVVESLRCTFTLHWANLLFRKVRVVKSSSRIIALAAADSFLDEWLLLGVNFGGIEVAWLFSSSRGGHRVMMLR